MKIFGKICLLLLLVESVNAESIFKIEYGKDYRDYTNQELQRRVWELERAVWQLQQRVFQLETTKTEEAKATWVCTITAMNQPFTGTGTTKALATKDATDKCISGNNGNGFFCKNPRCEQ